MSELGSISVWVHQLRGGDAAAAGKLWERYYARLVGMARQKLRSASRRMADEEDVVVQAFDSFLRGVDEGRFPKLDDRDDLWQVLVMITARKAVNQLKHETRQKRGGGRLRGESIFGLDPEGANALDQVVGVEPTPEFAGQIGEECHRLLDRLGDPTLQRVAVARMEGYSNAEIAAELGVQVRTVERKLRTIRELWSVGEPE